jgi:hypothetical protein
LQYILEFSFKIEMADGGADAGKPKNLYILKPAITAAEKENYVF